MNITLDRPTIIKVLFSIAGLLVLAHSIMLVMYFTIDDPDQFDFVRLIDLDYEGNLPTLFSALLFLINGTLLWVVSRSTREESANQSTYWFGLALIFVFLGFDEGSRIHEEIGDLFEHVVNAEGWLYFPWFIPYSILFVILTFIYFRFYLSLDPWLRWRLFMCAVIFLGGAVGLELFSAREADEHGTSTLVYSILYTFEESLEMTGLILFIDTLLLKLVKDPNKVTLYLS